MGSLAWYAWAPEASLAGVGLAAVLWKTMRIAMRVDAALPTLLDIADEFRNNGGSTLRDQLDAAHRQLEAVSAQIDQHTHQDEKNFAKLEGIMLGRSASPSTVVVNPSTPVK